MVKKTVKQQKYPLSLKEYSAIVKHYGRSIPKTRKGNPSLKKTRQLAEKLIASKLCDCMKSLENKQYSISSSSAICKNSILNSRNLTVSNFHCKKKHRLVPFKKNKTRKLMKTKPSISI